MTLTDQDFISYESKKGGKDKESMNQVPHLTQDTTRESDKIHLNSTNESKEVSPFPARYHKAAMNRRESIKNIRYK